MKSKYLLSAAGLILTLFLVVLGIIPTWARLPQESPQRNDKSAEGNLRAVYQQKRSDLPEPNRTSRMPESAALLNNVVLSFGSGPATEVLSDTQWISSSLALYSWPISMPDAEWIWKTAQVTPDESFNGGPIHTFRRRFNLPGDVENLAGTIQITADNAYELSVNGMVIGGDGVLDPSGMDPSWDSVESYLFNLVPGENEIMIRAINYGAQCTVEACNPAGLIFRVEITTRPVHLPFVIKNFCEDFFDDFSNPATGWEVGEDDFELSEYRDGEYRVVMKKAGVLYFYLAPTCARQDYAFEVNARWVVGSGSGYGLIFGIVGDFEQFYLFHINTDFGEYILLRRDASGWTILQDWTTTTAISPGTNPNLVEVTRRGCEIFLDINNATVGSWFDCAITGLTRAGVTAATYTDVAFAEARFDNFMLITMAP